MATLTHNLSTHQHINNRVYQQLSRKRNRQNLVLTMLLAATLGGFGAHKFYQRKYLAGTLYLLFSWTLIPIVFSLIDLFFIPSQVKWHNSQDSYRLLLEKAPNVAKDIEALMNVHNSTLIQEVVLKLIFGIMSAWLLYVAYIGNAQRIEKNQTFSEAISYYHEIK